MTDFKVGDKVRYIGNDNGNSYDKDWVGIEGEVTSVHTNIVYLTITKPAKVNSSTYRAGFEIYPSKQNLELIEKPFTFKDIQKGDLIRRTHTRKEGSKVIWEGVADHQNYDSNTWVTKDGNPLSYKGDDKREGSYLLELLERPEPPHWTEEKPVGSMFLYGSGEKKALWKKTTETGWTRTFLIDNHSRCYTLWETKNFICGEQEWLK